MSIPHHTRTEREDAWSNVDECLRDIDHVANGLPTGDMIDYAGKNGLGQEVIDGLERLGAAAGVLVYEGPEVIWDFAKAAGMTDELVAREQRERDERRAREADPNSFINMLRRREK
jgi:hypothetical protein